VREDVEMSVGEDAEVLAIEIRTTGTPVLTPLSARADHVVVTVGVEGSEWPAGVAAQIRSTLANGTYGEPTVEVRFVHIQTAGNVTRGPGSGEEPVSSDRAGYSSNGNSGSYSIAATAASRTSPTFSPLVTLM
jgi:hypothetical protein